MEGEKLKWKKDKDRRVWYILESEAWANNGAQIKHLIQNYRPYELTIDNCSRTFRFWKLKNAKVFYELFRNG